MTAQKQNYSAGDDYAEAQAKDRETLPFAGSREMQQKWQLHQRRAANRDANGTPDQAPSIRCRKLRRKSERSRSQIIG
jgi:hypothetical protein